MASQNKLSFKRRHRLSVFKISLTIGLFIGQVISNSFSQDVVQENRNSLVFLKVESTMPKTGAVESSTATGFVVCEEGYVLTNLHIIPKDEQGNYEKESFKGSIGGRFEFAREMEYIAADPEIDLMLLKFKGQPPEGIKSVTFGDANSLQVEDSLHSLGFPLNEDLIFKKGILSSKSGPRGEWITDVPLNFGDSGAPVFNDQDQVVAAVRGGIPEAQGINYVLPINRAKSLLEITSCGFTTEVITQPIPISEKEVDIDDSQVDTDTSLQCNDPNKIVTIPDQNLLNIIRATLNQSSTEVTCSALANLTYFDATEKDIIILAGIEYATNLSEMRLSENRISEISPLPGLIKLQRLELWSNPITDLAPLANLQNLKWLYLGCKYIIPEDLSPLYKLTKLKTLHMSYCEIDNIDFLTSARFPLIKELRLSANNISDVSALEHLPKLEVVLLDKNHISDIKPLVQNLEIDFGDYIDLRENPLSLDAIEDIVTLTQRGVIIDY